MALLLYSLVHTEGISSVIPPAVKQSASYRAFALFFMAFSAFMAFMTFMLFMLLPVRVRVVVMLRRVLAVPDTRYLARPKHFLQGFVCFVGAPRVAFNCAVFFFLGGRGGGVAGLGPDACRHVLQFLLTQPKA